jgi:hypothetical protein
MRFVALEWRDDDGHERRTEMECEYGTGGWIEFREICVATASRVDPGGGFFLQV